MARTLKGVVSSDKRDKTITVKIASHEIHPLYRKHSTVTRKYTAHDEQNSAHEGDTVMIAETRPISKTKSWTLVKILEKAPGKVELKEGVVQIADEKKADEAEKAEKIEKTEKVAKADKKAVVAEEEKL